MCIIGFRVHEDVMPCTLTYLASSAYRCSSPTCREVPESAANSEEEEDDAEDEAEDEKNEKEAMSTKKLVTKAVLMLLAGTIVCAVISDPMVDAVSNFSKVRNSVPLPNNWYQKYLLRSLALKRQPLAGNVTLAVHSD